MNTPFVMYKNINADLTLNPKYMTPYHKKSQVVEFTELVKLIESVFSKAKRALKILDIGVGDGRIPLTLSRNKIWKKIDLFVGIDNSQMEVDKAVAAIKNVGIENKVKIINFDALDLESRKFDLLEQKYDMIICTYFTPGNFKPNGIKVTKKSLNPNKNFIQVFKSAYEMLNPDGKIFLGSVYIDTDKNRKRQEDFYRKCGMTVITSKVMNLLQQKKDFGVKGSREIKFIDIFRLSLKKKLHLFLWITITLLGR